MIFYLVELQKHTAHRSQTMENVVKKEVTELLLESIKFFW